VVGQTNFPARLPSQREAEERHERRRNGWDGYRALMLVLHRAKPRGPACFCSRDQDERRGFRAVRPARTRSV